MEFGFPPANITIGLAPAIDGADTAANGAQIPTDADLRRAIKLLYGRWGDPSRWVPPKLLAYRSPDPMHWPRGVILELEQLSKYTNGDELRGLALYHIRKAAMARNWKKSIHCRTKHMTVEVLNALDVMRKDGEQDLMDLDDVASTIHTSVGDSGVQSPSSDAVENGPDLVAATNTPDTSGTPTFESATTDPTCPAIAAGADSAGNLAESVISTCLEEHSGVPPAAHNPQQSGVCIPITGPTNSGDESTNGLHSIPFRPSMLRKW